MPERNLRDLRKVTSYTMLPSKDLCSFQPIPGFCRPLESLLVSRYTSRIIGMTSAKACHTRRIFVMTAKAGEKTLPTFPKMPSSTQASGSVRPMPSIRMKCVNFSRHWSRCCGRQGQVPDIRLQQKAVSIDGHLSESLIGDGLSHI